jgi:hypothetical protein
VTLNEMRLSDLPRLDWHTILCVEDLSEADEIALNKYFSQFISVKDGECPCCKNKMGGGISGFLLAGAPGNATLSWGLVHGEAFCSQCRYPYRVYHRDVGPIKFLSSGLPYHPDVLIDSTAKEAPNDPQAS